MESVSVRLLQTTFRQHLASMSDIQTVKGALGGPGVFLEVWAFLAQRMPKFRTRARSHPGEGCASIGPAR